MNSINQPRPDRKPPTKSQDALEKLTAMAMALGPSAKLPTVTELRRDLQVSITTLDAVLTQLEHQNIIYRKQGSGIFVSSQVRQKCVGLVCEPAFFGAGSSPFWAQMVEAARLRALEGGEAFRFYLTMPSADTGVPVHSDLVDDVRARRIQGVIFVGLNEAAINWLEGQGVPAVVFAGRGNYRVEIDGEMFVRKALDHVLDRGSRRPALLLPWDVATEPAEHAFYSPEACEYRKVLTRRGLICETALVWETRAVARRFPPITVVPQTREEQGRQAVTTLLAPGINPPDALICVDDMMTRGVLRGLRELNLVPGDDIAVVSHINRGSTVLVGESEGLTFIEVDPAEIVQTLFSQLEYRMAGQEPPHHVISVPVRLLSP